MRKKLHDRSESRHWSAEKSRDKHEDMIGPQVYKTFSYLKNIFFNYFNRKVFTHKCTLRLVLTFFYSFLLISVFRLSLTVLLFIYPAPCFSVA